MCIIFDKTSKKLLTVLKIVGHRWMKRLGRRLIHTDSVDIRLPPLRILRCHTCFAMLGVAAHDWFSIAIASAECRVTHRVRTHKEPIVMLHSRWRGVI